MKFLSLKAKNVFSLGEVELDLQDRGLLLVTGYSKDDGSSNGAGKSSLANKALIWGLYGRTPDGDRADAVVNRHTDGESSVTVRFITYRLGERTYEIERSRSPAKLQYYSVYPDCVVDLTQKNERDTQRLIDFELGRDYNTFIQSDFFGQGRRNSFFELTPAEQKELVENILPLEELAQYVISANKSWHELSEAWDKHQAQLSVVEGQVLSLEDQSTRICISHTTWEAERQSRLRGLPTEATGDLEIVQKDLSSARRGVEKLTTSMNTLTAEVNTQNSLLSDAKILDRCNVCNQTLPKNAVASVKRRRGELLTNLKDIEFRLGDRQRLYLSETKRVEELEYQSRVIGRFLVRKSIEAETNPHDGLLESTANTISRLRTQKTNLSHYVKLLGFEKDIVDFWLEAFRKGIRTMMLEQSCPFLEAKSNQYLAQLNNPQFKVQFSTTKKLKSSTKDEFNVTVSSDTGGNSFSSLSGGEKQLVSFAVGLALADLAATQAEGASDMLILDEPFVGLSAENCENIVNFLTQCKKKTILLISNEDSLKTLTPNRVHVVKEGGVTNIATA